MGIKRTDQRRMVELRMEREGKSKEEIGEEQFEMGRIGDTKKN